MSGWQWYWLGWILVGFAAPETYALVRDPKDTLSETVWSWFSVKEGMPIWQWNVLHVLLLSFMVWLLGHMAFRIWR